MLGAGSAAGPNLAAIVSRAACSFAGGWRRTQFATDPPPKKSKKEKKKNKKAAGGSEELPAAQSKKKKRKKGEGGGMSCNSIEVAVALWQREKGN